MLCLTLELSRPLEIDSDNSVEEFEDALNADDEDIFAEPVPQNRLNHLSKSSTCLRNLNFISIFSNFSVEDHTEGKLVRCPNVIHYNLLAFADEILGCLQFVNNYRDRYGHGPNFFEGTLEDAVKTSCSTRSARDVSAITSKTSGRVDDFYFAEKASRYIFASRSKRPIQRVLWTTSEQREHHKSAQRQLCNLRMGFDLREQQEHVSLHIFV